MGKVKVLGRLMRKTEGSVAIITAVGLVAFLGMVSVAIDMGHLYTVRNELQNVADASALAAANALIVDSGGVAVRDATTSKQKALDVAQRESQVSNQAAVDDAHRTDLTILFGAWNINAGDPTTAWTEIGETCASDSNANAVKVTIVRGAGTVYGPVSNLFAGIFGSTFNTSTVGASAIAYLGFTNEVQTGGVQLPLALPSTGLSSPLASNGRAGWFASLFGPREAVASTPKTIKFRDTGGANVTVTSKKLAATNAAADANQPYFYTNRSTDSIPDAINYPMRKLYTPSLQGSTNVPVVMRDMKVGDQIWPGSEYRYPSSMTEMFGYLKSAYNAKKNGSTGKWRTTLVVHGLQQASALPRKGGLMSLARLLAPFWPSEAFACVQVQPPTLYVKTFVNVDITAVASGTGDYGDSYTYPKTISGVTYTDQKDFLNRYPNSTWNVNTATIQTTTDASTVSPPGSQTGGPSNHTINSGAPTNTGAFATTAVLVK